MDSKLTRRYFLGGAVAAGASTLLPQKAQALSTTNAGPKLASDIDTANASLTHASVAKV